MILVEALFVGITFCILSSIVHMFFMKIYGETSMEHYSLMQQSFISAFLFHIVFIATIKNEENFDIFSVIWVIFCNSWKPFNFFTYI